MCWESASGRAGNLPLGGNLAAMATEHGMQVASFSGGLNWQLLLRRHPRCRDLLEGTRLEPLGRELNFWLLAVEDILPSQVVDPARRNMGEALQFAETPRRPLKQAGANFSYKTLSVAPWPCVCADWYDGLKENVHTIYQWGQPSDEQVGPINHKRPRAPAPLDEALRCITSGICHAVAGPSAPPDAMRTYAVINHYVGDTRSSRLILESLNNNMLEGWLIESSVSQS